MGEGKRGEDEGITKLKTNVISAAAERKQCLLLGEACLAACSRGWVKYHGITLPLNVFCLCMLSLHREEEGRKQSGLYWGTSSCRYCGVVL